MRNPQHGLTMVELMVAVAIMSILMVIGVPSYRYVTTSNRVSAEVNGLLLDLQYARSEALKQGRTITVCPANTTLDNCAGNSNWQNGWIVFMDVNNNASLDDLKTEPLLKVQPSFAANKDTFVSDNLVKSITYNREGFAAGLTPAAGYITITLHDKTANKTWTRCLEVNTIGKVRVERVGDPNGNCT
jgi:type IV fimbrial biogenesis protein FimT